MKTNLFKTLIAIVLLSAMTLTMLASCDTGNGADTESTTDQETEAPVEPIVLASKSKTDYKLIKSQFIADEFNKIFIKFISDVKSDTGIHFAPYDDFYRKDVDPAAFPEILFGAANRDESRAVYAEIGYDGYAVKYVGNKVVIAAYTPEKIELAVKRFFEECISVDKTDEDNITVTYVKDIVEKGTITPYFNAENKLEDYVVIYSKEAESAAKRFVNSVEKRNNIELTMKPDSEKETEKEILIGDTNRKQSSDISTNKISFTFKVDGTKLVINSKSQGYLEGAIDYITKLFVSTAPIMNLAPDTNVTSLSYTGPESAELHEDADVRIMSFNILSEEWTKEAVMEPRILGVIGTILFYMPDVIGIQEVSTKWYGVLRSYLGDDYTFINSDLRGTKDNNYTALAYNKNTVKHLKSDLYTYSVYNSWRLRVVNFGLFELKSTGKQFGVTNTHFNANHNNRDHTPERTTQATEFVAKIKEYQKKYNCPIFMTGDFNSKDETAPYAVIVKDGTIKEAKYTAKVKGKICLTYHGLGSSPASGTSSIDHIFHTTDVTPLYYTTLVDSVLNITSDHNPIFADFKFNN